MTQSAYSWFTPGEDPEDEELGLGVFRYPDGTSQYGQDPEGAAALKAEGKVGPPPGDVVPKGMSAEYGPPAPPDEPTRNAVSIPQSSRLASVNNNPGNLRYAGQKGAREGEGGFAAFETPEAGASALYRQIDLDAGRGLTLKQFINKYAPPSENDTEGYVRNMVQFTGATEDTPIGQIDRDKLAAAVARQESSSTLGGTPQSHATGTSSAPPPGGLQIPGAPTGMVPAEAQQAGTPMTPQQLGARQDEIRNRTQQQREAGGEALLNQRLAMQSVVDAENADHQQRESQAKAELVQAELFKKQANEKIQAEVVMPIQQVDPARLIKNMSTGQAVLGGIGVLLSAIGQASFAMLGIQTTNYALDVINKAVDADIDAQKSDIAQGQASSKNRVAYWTRRLDSAEDGERAARLEMREAARGRIRTQSRGIDEATAIANATAVDQQLAKASEDDIAALNESEANKLKIAYKPPQVAARQIGPVATGPNDPIKTDPAYRAQVAAHFDENSPKDARQLEGLQKGMSKLTELRAAKQQLEQAYGVQPDAAGNYPAQGDYDSAATGPWWNVMDKPLMGPEDSPVHEALGLQNKRDRELKKAWATVQGAARQQWATEPNSVKVQEALMSIPIPARDEDVPESLTKLNAVLAQSEQMLESGTLPQVRAYFWSQQGPPVGATRVSGKVP